MDDPARSHVAAVAQPQSRQTRLFAGDVRAHFALGRTIGKGSFGKVKAAVARMPLELERGRGIGVGAHVAVKLVEATGWTATQYDEFYRECFLLAQVEHANVVRLIAVYKNARKSGRVEFAMVTELATGGELFDRIQRVGRFSERAASRVVRKLLGALSYLHARGIAHRDIKVVASLQSVRAEHAIALAGAHGRARRHGQPENVVFATGAKDAEVKLIDFGFAQKRDVQNGMDARFATRLGSPNYVAPEILLGQPYDERCDVWSLGVMLFIMLCGSFPFSPDPPPAGTHPQGLADAHMSVYRKIVHGRIEWVESEWAHVGAPARQLVRAMLTVDYASRPTAAECLRHPWIAVRSVPSKDSFPAVARENFGRFNAARHSSRRVGSATLPGGLLRSLVDSRFFGSRDYFSDFAMETETEDDGERAFVPLHRPGHRRLAAARPNGAAAGAMPGAPLDGRPVLAERVEGAGGGFGGFGRVVRSLKRVAGRKPRQT
eukprot:PRCOL_00000069-RA